MIIHLIREPATVEQIGEMLQGLSTYIKLAVDVEREILAGGGEYHADCEEVLLEDGSRQEDICAAIAGGRVTMRHREKMRARYLRDECPVRLGNLASNLLRLSQWAQMRHSDQAIVDLLCESAWLIEWSASDTPADIAAELVDMQRELCLWRRIWSDEAARPMLSLRTRAMSERVLTLPGLSG
jgi:hypothetical protein